MWSYFLWTPEGYWGSPCFQLCFLCLLPHRETPSYLPAQSSKDKGRQGDLSGCHSKRGFGVSLVAGSSSGCSYAAIAHCKWEQRKVLEEGWGQVRRWKEEKGRERKRFSCFLLRPKDKTNKQTKNTTIILSCKRQKQRNKTNKKQPTKIQG